MSQTAITKAFEQLKAQQAANGSVLVLDEFVFAYVPDLDPNAAIDRAESWPAASQIVERLAVSKTGRVNDNAVVYSVALGADVGDFEFNWIGLINKASNTVCMIVHAPVQKKIKTASGQQGNVLTRSFLMEYDGAAQQTQITTPVDTWQIDFTARLNGGDERVRRENVDLWGDAGFIGDGFLVTKSGTKYSVKNGAGYVAGLRAELLAAQDITVSTKPSKVWLDVCWRGTLTSEWQVVSKITVAETLADYYSGDEKHYVFALAEIAADGTVKDLRPVGNLPEQGAQPASPILGRFAALSVTEDSVPWFDKSGGVSLAALSQFMRLMLGKAELAEVYEYLGLGEAAKKGVGTGESQLLTTGDADERYIARSQALLGETGWHIDADTGMIRQWGKIKAATADTNYPVTFPITFAQEVYNIQCTCGYTGARRDISIVPEANNATVSGFDLNRQDIGSVASVPTCYIYWEAKGR